MKKIPEAKVKLTVNGLPRISLIDTGNVVTSPIISLSFHSKLNVGFSKID